MKVKFDHKIYIVPFHVWVFFCKNLLILKLKRIKRFLERIIKNFGIGFLVTVLLFFLYIGIAIIVDPKINCNNSMYKTIWNCMPMMYTGIVVTFVSTIINYEINRHRCLKKQWVFYSNLSFTYTYYLRQILEIAGVRVTGDCIENNEAVNETEKEINVADIHIGPGEVSQIINVLKEYQDELVDESKTWLSYEFIDFNFQDANRYWKDLKNLVNKLIEQNNMDKENLLSLLSDCHYFLSRFRKPWRHDEKINGNMRKILSNEQCIELD